MTRFRIAGGVNNSRVYLSVNQYQRSAAAFCSTWIWQEWQPDHPFFDAIHDGLLGQRPQLTRVDTRQLCDDLTAVARADHRLWLHRLLDAPLTTMVDVPSLDGQIWVDGLNVVRRAPPPDEASPVRGGVAPLIIRRLIRLDGAEVRCEEAAPVAVWPAREPAAVALVAYGADRIVLRAEGSGEQAEMDRLGQWRLTDARPCTMTIVITDGRYPVAPGSLHRMRWVTWFGKAIPTQPAEVGVGRGDDTITAGPDGRLVLHPTEPGQLITLTPVSPPPPAPAAATE